MNKKAIFSLILVLTLSSNIAVKADTLNDRLKNQKQQLQSSQSSYKNVEVQINELEDKIQNLDVKIEGILDEIDQINVKIKNKENDIKSSEKNIYNEQLKIDKQQDMLGERAKNIYMGDSIDVFAYLFSATGVNDLINKMQNVQKMMEDDIKQIDEFKEEKKKIEEFKLNLQNDKAQLEKLKQSSTEKLRQVNEEKKNQQKVVSELENKKIQFANEIAKYNAEINDTLKQLEELRKQEELKKNSAYSVGAAGDISSNAIVAYTSKFLGVPYVWGGTSPSGFDCSGLMQYVYSKFGVSIPRVAADQARVGKYVTREELQPGDLIFFKNASGYIYHVGMYIGNDKYIQAPQTGDVVKVSSLSNRTNFSHGRRVI